MAGGPLKITLPVRVKGGGREEEGGRDDGVSEDGDADVQVGQQGPEYVQKEEGQRKVRENSEGKGDGTSGERGVKDSKKKYLTSEAHASRIRSQSLKRSY